MAIQSRRGKWSDFDPAKLLPGETSYVLEGDPNSTDGQSVYSCFKAGKVKRMATYEDMQQNIQNATSDIQNQFTEELQQTLANAETTLSDVETALDNANDALSEIIDAVDSANTATAAANEAAQKANEAAANAGELPNRVDQIESEVDNLYDMTNGKSVDDNAYSVTVPNGAKFATVKKLGGKSIAWNQIFDAKSIAASNSRSLDIASAFKDHIYIITNTVDRFPAENNDTDYQLYITLNNANSMYYIQGKSVLYSAKEDGQFVLRIATYAEFQGTVTIDNIQCFDLTQMFGAGNEPSTVEEFNSLFPEEYYPYNAGEIVSAEVENVVEQGKNLLRPNWFNNQTVNGLTFTNNGDGTYTVNGTATAEATVSKQISGIKKAHKYLLKGCPQGGSLGTYSLNFTTSATLVINDTGDGAIGTAVADGITWLVLRVKNGTTVNNIVYKPQYFDLTEMFGAGNEPSTVEEFNAIYPNDFYPYRQNTYPIPDSIKSLDGYGWSAGDVYNEVDFENKKFIQRVGHVLYDGSLTYRCDDNYTRPDYKYNYVYSTVTLNKAKASGGSISILGGTRRQYDYTHSGQTITTVVSLLIPNQATENMKMGDYIDKCKQWLTENPIDIYYELAEPVITDISDILESFEVESGGTISFVQSDDTKLLPVPNTIEYDSSGADKIAQLEEKIDDVKTTADTAKSTADNALSSVNSLNEQVEDINTEITGINQNITEINSEIDDINAHITAEKDYIVEQGTSGIWTYRKWNSGIAECWLSEPWTYNGSLNFNVASWANGYEPAEGRIALPNFPTLSFQKIPNCFIEYIGTNALSSDCMIIKTGENPNTLTAPPIFKMWRGTQAIITNPQFTCFAIGKWKID